MPKYEVSSTHYFRETGEKVEAGETVELTEAEAAENNDRHPGLLKSARLTTQGHADTVRESAPIKPRKRVSRTKK